MAVDYRVRQPLARPEQLAALEQRIGVPLPDDYRRYLAAQNGGALRGNSEAVKAVFGFGHDIPGWANMAGMLDAYADRVPSWRRLLPVAMDEYGNLFAVSLRPQDRGSVWFWDHEEEADEGDPPTEDNIKRQADNWTAFLDQLLPPPLA
jgi:cell wall assembly regulator SMI1